MSRCCECGLLTFLPGAWQLPYHRYSRIDWCQRDRVQSVGRVGGLCLRNGGQAGWQTCSRADVPEDRLVQHSDQVWVMVPGSLGSRKAGWTRIGQWQILQDMILYFGEPRVTWFDGIWAWDRWLELNLKIISVKTRRVVMVWGLKNRSNSLVGSSPSLSVV